MASLFWVGGTATWDGTPLLKWSATSGGVGGLSVPTAADDVFFDSNSTGTCTLSASSVCRSLDCNTFTATISHPGSTVLTIGDGSGGSLRLSTGMTYTKSSTTSSTISMVSTTTGNTVTTNGKVLGGITFNGAGGGWTLQDTLNANGSVSTVVTLTAGTLITNNQTINCGRFDSSGASTRVLTLGSSTVNCSGTSTAWNMGTSGGITFTQSGSTINFTNTASTAREFRSGSLSYGAVSFTGGNAGVCTISAVSGCTFTALTLGAGSGGSTYTFTKSVTFTCTTLNATGSSGNVITINDTSGTHAIFTISVASGTVSCDWLNIVDCTAAGSTPFYAGANSTDSGHNTLWTFTAPPGPSTLDFLLFGMLF